VTTSGFAGGPDEEDEEEESGPPRKCQICEEEYRSPVVTSCKHYFCEKCIFDEYRKSKNCPVCSKTLNGIFNIAHDVIARDKVEERGGKKGKTQAKREKIILNKSEGRKEVREKGEEDEGGLEGVEFGEEESEEEPEKKEREDDFDMDKMIKEYKSGQNKRGKFELQSDWNYS